MTRKQQPDTDALGVRHGRRPPSRTEVYDWVPLSGVCGGAVLLYTLLRMHVSRARGDELVWTSTLTLAVMMGFSRGDKITGYLRQLEAVQAVEVVRGNAGNRNVYLVHALPPPGYTGCLGLRDWYERNRAAVDAKRDAEKAARDSRRAAARAARRVPPNRGEHDPPGVPPDRGELVTPDRGQPVTPDRGREPTGCEPAGIGTSPPSPPRRSRRPPPPQEEERDRPSEDPPPPVGGQLSPDEAQLAEELVRLRPGWSAVTLQQVLADPVIRARRDWDLVAAAFRLAAADTATTTARRMLHDACPHWATAERQRTPAAARRAAPRVAAQWCGAPDCDPLTRQLLDPVTGNPLVGLPLCPTCHPPTGEDPP